PSINSSIRAIPGVAMLEDALSQPYRTAVSGDIPGAWGDAVDLSGQVLSPELLRRAQIPDVDISRAGDIAKGAAQGAGRAGIEPIKHFGYSFPAPIAYALPGEIAGRLFGVPGVGAAAGAVFPMVRGAIRGARDVMRSDWPMPFDEPFRP